mgnify:CR=1 FL=1|tara:strand:+ start:562 stop:996 length:435 start_codon:yes stop_codon:yes gene_type:complete
MALTTERQTYLLRLRRRGHSISAISEMLSIPISSVQSSLSGAYKKLVQEHEAIEARQLELDRLDEVQASYYEPAVEGDHKAAEVVFKAMDRRAKLLGLDAPEQKKVETSFSIAWLDDEDPTVIDGNLIEENSNGKNTSSKKSTD